MNTGRSQRMLDMLKGSSPRAQYVLIKVLETGNLVVCNEDELEETEQQYVFIYKEHNKRCHALVIHRRDKATLNDLKREMDVYEKLFKQYQGLGMATTSTQTDKVPVDFKHVQTEYVPSLSNAKKDESESHVLSTALSFILTEQHSQESKENSYNTSDIEEEQVERTSSPLSQISVRRTGQSNQGGNFTYTDLDNSRASSVPSTFEQCIAEEEQHEPREETSNVDIEDPASYTKSSHGHGTCDVEKGSKKSHRKQHCCKYCSKIVKNFSRHIKKIHGQEDDVVLYAEATENDKLRILRRIQAEGDDKYNQLHPECPIVRRASSSIEVRDKCPHCKLLVSKFHSVDHLRKCFPDGSERSGKAIRVDIVRENLLINEKINDLMKSNIIPFMRNDTVTQLCKHDESLILYGNKMCERLRGENQEKTIRNHLRIVGRVAETTFKIDPSIKSVIDMFDPTKYDIFVEAVYEICGFGQADGGEMKKPTTPHQYGPRMRELSDYIVTTLLKKKDPSNADDTSQINLKKQIELIESWQAVYDREFDKQVASLGRRQADRRSFESKQLTPSMNDVQQLIEYVQSKTEKSYANLLNRFTSEEYFTLSKCLLLRLWIFNRRRVGEVDKLRLKNWLAAKEIDENSDQYKTLTPTEQRFASSYIRLCVQGKLRRPVALLVPKKDMECYTLLISLRSKAKIKDDNVYLFATYDRYIEGTSVMKEFAQQSGAKNWRLLTGTRLRKQLAASLRYLNLTDEDLRLVAEAMGHTEKTHMLHYRKNDAALHAGRVSKVLMAIDDGTIQNHLGKSLDEIDVDVVLEDPKQVQGELVNVDVEDHQYLLKEAFVDLAEESFPSQPSVSRTSCYHVTPEKRIIPSSRNEDDDDWTPSKAEYERKLSSDSDRDTTARGNTPGRKRAYSKRTMKTSKRFKWSNEMKNALKDEMFGELSPIKCSSGKITNERILQAMKSLEGRFPEIMSRSPRKVRVMLNNIAKKKLKLYLRKRYLGPVLSLSFFRWKLTK